MKYYYYLLDNKSKSSDTYEVLQCPAPLILKHGHELQASVYTPLSNIDLLLLVKKKSARIFILKRKGVWKEVDLEGKLI